MDYVLHTFSMKSLALIIILTLISYKSIRDLDALLSSGAMGQRNGEQGSMILVCSTVERGREQRMRR
jgi:hypothetical protein